MSRKATLDALFGGKPGGLQPPSPAPAPATAPAPERKSADPSLGAPNSQALGAPNAPEPARIRSGAIGAMGASLQHLREEAKQAEALRASVAQGEQVLEIDPALIDDAPVADRFREEADPALEELTESIRVCGQQIPILVRPHPTTPGRWQAAYGHRRIRACRAAGVAVKALVRPLSDTALAVAQGKENLERRNLSFIEKAFFAAGLDRAGFTRAVISDALGSDRADVSRFIALARALPEDLVRLIGSAPRTGRARWQELVEAVAAREARGEAAGSIVAHLPLLQGFQRADSDQRFRMVIDRLRQPAAQRAEALRALVTDASGQPLVTLKEKGATRLVSIDDRLCPGFADHLAGAIPALYERWRGAPSTPKE